MPISDWLSLIDSLGLIATGSLLGSFITILVKHFLDKGRLKTERQSSLQKEIYFRLQGQAGKMFEVINLLRRQVEEMAFWMEKRQHKKISSISLTERIRNLSSAQVFFSEIICEKYNDAVESFGRMVIIYGDMGKGILRAEQIKEWNEKLAPAFHNYISDCAVLILEELKNSKKMIL